MSRKKRQAYLFDLFVGGQAGTDEIAIMSLEIVTRNIHELREVQPDNIPMSDVMIASAILEYAREDQCVE